MFNSVKYLITGSVVPQKLYCHETQDSWELSQIVLSFVMYTYVYSSILNDRFEYPKHEQVGPILVLVWAYTCAGLDFACCLLSALLRL